MNKRSYKRLLGLLLTVTLTITMLLPCVVLPLSAAATRDTETVTYTDAHLSLSALLSSLLGTPISDAEADWLDHEADTSLSDALSVALTYDTTVPHTLLSSTVTTDGDLTITALAHTPEEGMITWTPTSVMVCTRTFPLTSDGHVFTATVPRDALPNSPATAVTVTYSTSIALPSEAADALANAAYDAVLVARKAQAAYEKAYADWQTAQAAYNTYLAAIKQYRSELATYNAYRDALAVYESRLDAYETYLADLSNFAEKQQAYEVYLTEKAAYEQALAVYLDFLRNPRDYEARYLAYRAYQVDLDTVAAQLALIESCFIRDTEGHQFYATLTGPTVATVVARRDELISVGCDEVDIANADLATAALIALLDAYPRGDTEAVRYTYYIENYTSLRDNVTLLYESLARLYGNDTVPDILQMQGKKERYWQFVAQLYVLSCALDDNTIIDENWSIAEGKLYDLLDRCYLLTDRNTATPLSSYPAAVEAVVPPAEMKVPNEPTRVEAPIEPLPVVEPTRPDEVRMPVPPLPVDAPGDEPLAPTVTGTLATLMDMAETNTLTRRPTLDPTGNGLVLYTPTVSVEHAASLTNRPVAAFYDDDRMTLLDIRSADENGLVSPAVKAPEKAPDPAYTYAFDGWTRDTGEPLDTTESLIIQEDIAFYATYARTSVLYTVKWHIGDTVIETHVPYGALPTPPDAIAVERAPDTRYVYVFTGWSPALSPVTGNTEYTAYYTTLPRTYTVTWSCGESTETEEYAYGATPSYNGTPTRPATGRYRYIFKDWSPAVEPVTGDTIYHAVFEAEDLIPHMPTDAVVMITETANGWGLDILSDGWDHANCLTADISRLAFLAAESGGTLTVRTENLSVTLYPEEVRALVEAGAVYLLISGTASESTAFSMGIQSENGTALPLSLRARVTVSDLSEGMSLSVQNADGKTVSTVATNGQAVFDAVTDTTYNLCRGYCLTLIQTEGGLIRTEYEQAAAGETVYILATAQPGYVCHGVTVTTPNGTILPVSMDGNDAYTFTMPADMGSTVTITADFQALTYTITFMANGTVISTATYRYGETPIPPTAPDQPADETNSYIFTGWSPAILPVMGDATYEAQYFAVPLGGTAVIDTALKLRHLVLMGCAAFMLTAGGVLTPYFIIRKRKRKHHVPNSDAF